MGRFATGVTLLTTVTPEGVYGMTANAVTSVSLEPTLVLVCVQRDTLSHAYLAGSRVFALNILSAAQEHLSILFSQDEYAPERRLTTVAYRPAGSGSAVIDGCLAYLDCQVVAQYPGGDHTIFVGEVTEASVLEGEAEPLVFYRGGYHRVRR